MRWLLAAVLAGALSFSSLAQTIVPGGALDHSAAQSVSETQLVSLKEYIYQIISERDRQYAQRFEAQQKAVDAALAAQDKATAAAFSAAEKAVAAALAAQEKATNAAFAAANSAVSKAELANEKRLDSVNEFRGQLKDQAALLATRTEVGVQFKAQGEKIETLNADIISMRARSEGASSLWALIAGAVGLLVGVAVATMAVLRYRRREPVESHP